MAGYGFAKFRFAGRDRLFRLLLGALVIPAQVAMLPLFLMLRALGVINTYWGVVIPGVASVFGISPPRQYRCDAQRPKSSDDARETAHALVLCARAGSRPARCSRTSERPQCERVIVPMADDAFSRCPGRAREPGASTVPGNTGADDGMRRRRRRRAGRAAVAIASAYLPADIPKTLATRG